MVNLEEVSLILDIDGVLRDCSDSYLRALADTVEHFTNFAYRPTNDDIDLLKAEGLWNNDWEASKELVERYFKRVGKAEVSIAEYPEMVAFFQNRYWGSDLTNPNGYISQEPLIANLEFFHNLTHARIAWGFFSGATIASASYVLNRIGITDYKAILVAMENAPGKPDPTGLLQARDNLGNQITVIYAGDTVADMLTVRNARNARPELKFVAVGILPPHVHPSHLQEYAETLRSHGADLVLPNVLELTPEAIAQIIELI